MTDLDNKLTNTQEAKAHAAVAHLYQQARGDDQHLEDLKALHAHDLAENRRALELELARRTESKEMRAQDSELTSMLICGARFLPEGELKSKARVAFALRRLFQEPTTADAISRNFLRSDEERDALIQLELALYDAFLSETGKQLVNKLNQFSQEVVDELRDVIGSDVQCARFLHRKRVYATVKPSDLAHMRKLSQSTEEKWFDLTDEQRAEAIELAMIDIQPATPTPS
jgi:hypothetical protein